MKTHTASRNCILRVGHNPSRKPPQKTVKNNKDGHSKQFNDDDTRPKAHEARAPPNLDAPFTLLRPPVLHPPLDRGTKWRRKKGGVRPVAV